MAQATHTAMLNRDAVARREFKQWYFPLVGKDGRWKCSGVMINASDVQLNYQRVASLGNLLQSFTCFPACLSPFRRISVISVVTPCWVSCDGLASHPGGSSYSPCHFMLVFL